MAMNNQDAKSQEAGAKVKTALVTAAVTAAIVAAYFIGRNNASTPNRQPPQHIDIMVVEQRLSSVSELATVSYKYTDVANIEKNEKLWGMTLPFSTSRMWIKYGGEIKAGVDLHKARVEVKDDTLVIISLPRPQILSHSVNPSGIKILNQDSGLFSSIGVSDFNKFCATQKDSMEAQAVARGLLDAASAKAVDGLEIVAAPLRDMGYSVHIVTSGGNMEVNRGVD